MGVICILNKVPGFRSNRLRNKIIGVIGYVFLLIGILALLSSGQTPRDSLVNELVFIVIFLGLYLPITNVFHVRERLFFFNRKTLRSRVFGITGFVVCCIILIGILTAFQSDKQKALNAAEQAKKKETQAAMAKLEEQKKADEAKQKQEAKEKTDADAKAKAQADADAKAKAAADAKAKADADAKAKADAQAKSDVTAQPDVSKDNTSSNQSSTNSKSDDDVAFLNAVNKINYNVFLEFSNVGDQLKQLGALKISLNDFADYMDSDTWLWDSYLKDISATHPQSMVLIIIHDDMIKDLTQIKSDSEEAGKAGKSNDMNTVVEKTKDMVVTGNHMLDYEFKPAVAQMPNYGITPNVNY